MFRLTPSPVKPIPLSVPDRIKFDGDPEWWTVRAVTENFAALTRPVIDRDHAENRERYEDADRHVEELEGDVFYTVIDWDNGWRGPCNLIGQSWGNGTYSESECAAMLADFESGDLKVSHRNQVRIEIVEGPA